jgi:hypothetical protein
MRHEQPLSNDSVPHNPLTSTPIRLPAFLRLQFRKSQGQMGETSNDAANGGTSALVIGGRDVTV